MVRCTVTTEEFICDLSYDEIPSLPLPCSLPQKASTCNQNDNYLYSMICIGSWFFFFSSMSLAINLELLEAAELVHHPPAVVTSIHLWPTGLLLVGLRFSGQLNHLSLGDKCHKGIIVRTWLRPLIQSKNNTVCKTSTI